MGDFIKRNRKKRETGKDRNRNIMYHHRLLT